MTQNEGSFLPRGYVETERWIEFSNKCDPGDPNYNSGIHFIPHKKHQAPYLTEVISMKEHSAILAIAKEYMDHHRRCSYFQSKGFCDCGFTECLKKLEELINEMPVSGCHFYRHRTIQFYFSKERFKK